MTRAAPPRLALIAAMTVILAGCGSTAPTDDPAPASAAPPTDTAATSPSQGPEGAPIENLGGFADLTERPLPDRLTRSLQTILDRAVEDGSVDGITASVIVAGAGTWAGAAGDDADGARLTTETPVMIGSVGKTVTAAQVIRLVEDGTLGLDDPITEHLPEDIVSAFDANDATVRDVLGMRSGILDPSSYEATIDAGVTAVELLSGMLRPTILAGSETNYANINYVLLGLVIEHESGRTLWDVIRSDVLSDPSLDGFSYPREDAFAADGWQIECDAATLARWGYELYGGSVLSDASLREMTDFREWYGLGAIDYSHASVDAPYDTPAIGHGGVGSGAAFLVAFPAAEVVIAIQTPTGSLEAIYALTRILKEAVEA